MPLELRGERVLLRPLRPEELDLLDAPHEGVVDLLGDSGAHERLRHRIAHSGWFFEGRLDLGIEVDGRLVGSVEARRPRRALPPGIYELGITLFADHDRGRGYGTEAIRLIADHLFAAMGAERVQASADVANGAMRHVFEKLGFVEEGVMRGFMPSAEGRADYVLYGITKAEWSKSALEVVVAPPNSLVLVVTTDDAEIPASMDGVLASTSTCVAVGTKSEVDGKTKLVLNHLEEPTDSALNLAFDGLLESQGFVRIVSVTGDTYLESSLGAPSVRIRIWVNDPSEPDIVIVSAAGR